MYKLAVQLPTDKIYVLCRGSLHQAMEKWEDSMPEEIDEIWETGKIHFLTGDITHAQLGLGSHELKKLKEEVTVVIHAAADFSFSQPLVPSVQTNCLPVLALADMLRSFHKIKVLLHMSSVSAKSFQSENLVLENMEHTSPDEPAPNDQLAEILATGNSPYSERFLAPYAQSKYLTERLLLEQDFPFPLLIVRPANIGPAIRDPYPFYGPEGSIPLHTFANLLLMGNQYRTFNDVEHMPQDIILDEIPVDVASNVCLHHIAMGSSGIVHAGSQLYVPVTIGEWMMQIRRHTSQDLIDKVARLRLQTNVDFAKQASEILNSICRAWIIDCQRSKHLKGTEGAIGLSFPKHDFDTFFGERVKRRSRKLEQWIDGAKRPN